MANSFSNINSRDMSASVAAVSEAARACERAETFSVTTDIQGTAAVIWISTKYSGNAMDPLDSPRTPRYRQQKKVSQIARGKPQTGFREFAGDDVGTLTVFDRRQSMRWRLGIRLARHRCIPTKPFVVSRNVRRDVDDGGRRRG
mmetsp:Transcript_5601/g.21991  ORF Transcript_5601/g.21991 Transcript_5601/m.21991 type:complete len:144 (-) Transcript_5601:1549-1980(-)